jgi:hypothetical protein
MTDTIVIDRHGRERVLRDDELIADGERMRTSLKMMDADQRAVYEGTRARVADTRVVDGRERAYRDAVTDETWAWKRAGVPDAYPLSSGEGSICTVNGRPGHLRQAKDGSPWLECVADEVGAAPAKTDAVSRRADAMSLKDALRKLDAVRELALEEVRLRDENSWRLAPTSGVAR